METEQLKELAKEWLNYFGENGSIADEIHKENGIGVYLEGDFTNEYIETYHQTYDSPAEGYVDCSFDGKIVEFGIENDEVLQEIAFKENWRID